MNIQFRYFWALTVVLLPFTMPAHAKSPAPVYLSDLSQCEPAEALSNQLKPDHWRTIPYQSEHISGVMVGARSFISAPEITLPLSLKGWYSVSIGLWNPHLFYDGKPIVKVRLKSDPVFQQVHPGVSPDNHDTTFLEEVFLFDAEMTGEDMVIAKSNGLQPRMAYVAYFKFVPLTDDQIKKKQPLKSSRNLTATIDGSSLFHYSECSTVNQFLEPLAPYRDSDVEKVLWAVNYGDDTNFPTDVEEASFIGDDPYFSLLKSPLGNDYLRGQKQMHQFLTATAGDKKLPLQRAAEYAHEMGLQFDLMFRLGILGGLGVSKSHEANFVRRHPEWRQQLKDGTYLEKASYAYPEVQQLILDLITDSCRKIKTDGVNLCFVRGPHFLQFEKPVRDAFQSEYGIDSLTLPEEDPRLGLVRAKIMTRFIRKVREQLDTVEKKQGRHLTLSVWVWPFEQNVWLGKHPLDEGLDVKTWLREGLLDSVICQEGIDQEYITLGNEIGAEFVLFTGYRDEKAMSPDTIQKAMHQGVSHFAYWDIDAVQHNPVIWKWLRHSGDPEALATFVKEPGTLKRKLIPLLQINQCDVEKGLKDAVYSGG